MTNYEDFELIPVPRRRIFVMKDGTFVVQWEERRVQALLDGRYLAYEPHQFGNAITDYELNQLRNSGVVEGYDDELVYLFPRLTNERPAQRAYYVNTTLTKSHMQDVARALQDAALNRRFSVRVQGLFVIVRGAAGMAFATFDAAEQARLALVEAAPALLGDSVVAFVEMP